MNNSIDTKILILSCGTGEGHNSAARAIEASLLQRHVPCEMKDVLLFHNKQTCRRVTGLYNGMIRKIPVLFGAVYHLGEFYDALRLPSPVYALNAKYAENLKQYILEQRFSCVICTHLFAMEALTAIRKTYEVQVPFYGVFTDYVSIPFYKDTRLDGYFVPNEKIGEQLRKKGIPQEHIFPTGIPVHPKFNQALSKQEARERLGLPPEKHVVAVMTGGDGCGKVMRLCGRLDRVLNEDSRILVFVGRNEERKKKLDDAFGGNSKFQILSFTDDMHLYLRAADVVISKSGGLSSTEIAVAHVPLVHLKAIPGVETKNAKFFSENGLSLRTSHFRQAVAHTVRLLKDPEAAQAMCDMQKRVIPADAAEKITEIITEGTK